MTIQARYIRCTTCMFTYDSVQDPYSWVVPHGAWGLNRERVPVCRDCRVELGYDVILQPKILSEERVSIEDGKQLQLLGYQPRDDKNREDLQQCSRSEDREASGRTRDEQEVAEPFS